MCTPVGFVARNEKGPPRIAEALRGQALLGELVVAHARVVARPPIGAPGGKCLPAKPPAIAAIGVVVGAIDPDPHAIPEDPVTEAVMIVVVIVALGKATIAVAVVTITVAAEGLGVSTTHVALRARAIEIAVRVSGAAIHTAAIVASAAPADEVATADVRSATHLRTAAAAAKPAASTTGEGLATAASADVAAATSAAATSAAAKSAAATAVADEYDGAIRAAE